MMIKLSREKISSALALLTAITGLFSSAASIGNECNPENSIAYKQLIKYGVTVSKNTQMDFGRLRVSSPCYLEAWPENTKAVSDIVKIAYSYNIPIRTQGGAHSENGSSLPKKLELLIHTSQLKTVSFDHLNSLTAGAGIPIAYLKLYVSDQTSYFIPVANGGGIGPTVGGFISAGGMNESSEYYGGFWENVDSVTLVTGEGKVQTINRDNPIFRYLFGSMGQLGVITQAELRLLPRVSKPYQFTLGATEQFTFPITDGSFWKKEKFIKPVYWLNLLIEPARLAEARRDLSNLQKKYPHAMLYMPIYQWSITFFNFTPPLIYDKRQNFYATGIWGTQSIHPDSQEQLQKLNSEFNQLVLSKKYKRYIQAEPAGSPELYKLYFPADTYNQFRRIKSALDPKFLFNKGSVF